MRQLWSFEFQKIVGRKLITGCSAGIWSFDTDSS